VVDHCVLQAEAGVVDQDALVGAQAAHVLVQLLGAVAATEVGADHVHVDAVSLAQLLGQ
jgi:hypothetical protein